MIASPNAQIKCASHHLRLISIGSSCLHPLLPSIQAVNGVDRSVCPGCCHPSLSNLSGWQTGHWARCMSTPHATELRMMTRRNCHVPVAAFMAQAWAKACHKVKGEQESHTSKSESYFGYIWILDFKYIALIRSVHIQELVPVYTITLDYIDWILKLGP